MLVILVARYGDTSLWHNSFTTISTCFTRFTSTDHVLSVLHLNIKTYTIAFASDVHLIICRRFVIKEEKLKIQSYILLDGLVCRVSMDIFMSPL